MRFCIACVRAACVLFGLVLAIAWPGPSVALADNDDQHHEHHEHHDKVDIKGTVTANDGTPVAGALIVIISDGIMKQAHSDARGAFELKDVRGGTYALHVAARRLSSHYAAHRNDRSRK